MTKEQFEDLKNSYIENLESFISENGGLFPHITLFATNKEDNKPSMIHFPIPSEFMKDDKQKDILVTEVIPSLAKKVIKTFDVIALVWASEAWLRTLDKDEEMPEDYTSLPIKKEVVMVTIEDENGVNNIVYDIHRTGKQVTEEGDIVDSIKLEKSEELSGKAGASEGRFVGLLKHFVNKNDVIDVLDEILNKIISKKK